MCTYNGWHSALGLVGSGEVHQAEKVERVLFEVEGSVCASKFHVSGPCVEWVGGVVGSKWRASVKGPVATPGGWCGSP